VLCAIVGKSKLLVVSCRIVRFAMARLLSFAEPSLAKRRAECKNGDLRGLSLDFHLEREIDIDICVNCAHLMFCQ
jgi:hypothetical protein